LRYLGYLRYRRQAIPLVAAVAVFHRVWSGRSQRALDLCHVVGFDGQRDTNGRDAAD
jgi:hypothetical protein